MLEHMTEPGLRERKKARTRHVIADAAARLFAERGYEQVAVSDVAREAEVSEQTVYNYFQTKEQLVTDRDQLVQDELSPADPHAGTRNHPSRSHPRIRARPRGGDPPHSRRAVARRARLPRRDQPDRPPARAGDVRPSGQRPRRRDQRDRKQSRPRSPGCRESRWPASSRSSSARPDAAPARAKARTRSPTSCGQPSKRSSTTSTAGLPRRRPRTAETARRRYPLRHLSHLAEPGLQKALPKANHRKGPPSATAAAVAVADLRRLARAGRGVSSALRRKLGDRAGSLQTVRGAGYRFIAPPAGCLVSAATGTRRASRRRTGPAVPRRRSGRPGRACCSG